MGFSTVSFAEGRVIWHYTGLDNYQTFLTDSDFPRSRAQHRALRHRHRHQWRCCLGLVLALLVSQMSSGGSRFVRAVLMIPILVPAIAIGTVWRLMYNYEFGIFNSVLSFPAICRPRTGPAASPWRCPRSCWSTSGTGPAFVFLLMLAGIESLPIEPMEAARVDGARPGSLLRHVMLPLLRPTILVALDVPHDLRLQGLR